MVTTRRKRTATRRTGAALAGAAASSGAGTGRRVLTCSGSLADVPVKTCRQEEKQSALHRFRANKLHSEMSRAVIYASARLLALFRAFPRTESRQQTRVPMHCSGVIYGVWIYSQFEPDHSAMRLINLPQRSVCRVLPY